MDDTPKRKSRKTRPALSADRIAAEAMALCDEAGFDAVSFRALGKRLGCEAMSLYHYFPSKQHLVDAMVNTCLAETPVPSPGPPARERMRALCHAYRATAVRHAGFAPILFTHRLNHREGLAWLDEVAGIFDDTRADDLRRATVFRVISYYLIRRSSAGRYRPRGAGSPEAGTARSTPPAPLGSAPPSPP
jgi:AcrR family transcriptional regulator